MDPATSHNSTIHIIQLSRRLEACSSSYGSSSLLHRIRMVNAYALSGLTFIMRVILIPDHIATILKNHILRALGTK